MAGKVTGRAVLLKISAGAGGFQAFGGMTAKSLKIAGERMDATTPDPASPEGVMWRETLAGAKSIDLSGDFTSIGDAAEKRAIATAMGADGSDAFQVIWPGLGTWQGNFSFDIDLSADDVAKGSISLQSTGPITFTAEA